MRIRKGNLPRLEGDSAHAAMLVRVLRQNGAFIEIADATVMVRFSLAIMAMGHIAAFVLVEMIVNRAIFVRMDMGMQHRSIGGVYMVASPSFVGMLSAVNRNLLDIALVTHRLYPLYNKNRNNGAPRNDVIAPIGKMTGEMIMRATRSLASMMADPNTRDAGNRNR